MRDEIPEVGDGATIHDNGHSYPATVVRVAFEGRAIWLQRDAVVEEAPGQGRFLADPTAFTCRALRQPDGGYREDHEKRKVAVGRRELRWSRVSVGIPGERGPTEFGELFANIEPWLLRTRWYPMTYMMIPSVLSRADELIAEMDAYRGPERETVQELRSRLAARRDGFKRIP
ncbi:hypothetical protein [Anaeromyxobacter paludicola]|uniref:Uncharacterized protein n=1 Tax=Anaeromyxobacter paludicola TaxID=2918171 RepID=A0ABM7X9T5_9BACT|nr:hypothetical protein [Anaeromyxobacter paludicola]BDG08606.1 hypothetical protein AMPC_17190 [Anaeromyxobacter paludicola]